MCRIGQNFLHISFILQKLCPILYQTCVGNFMLNFGKHNIKEILLLVQCDVKVRDKQLHSIPNSDLLQLVSVVIYFADRACSFLLTADSAV